jgi:Na+/melibiose symporter-like transporter
VSFALLFADVPVDSQWARFAYYAALYALWTTASTVLTVPYVALLPELTPDYNERTSLSIYRSASGQLGTMIAALVTQPSVRALGGGAYAYLVVGIVYGVWLTWPWLVVFFSTRERPEFQRPVQTSFVLGLRLTLRHRAYRRLMALYLCSRVAMDVTGALLVFYFTYWLRRPADFELAMGALLGAVMLSLPFWLRVSRSHDKRAIFIWGTSWWLITMLCFVLATPDWPRWFPLALGGIAGLGYAVADLMPWSMLADVVDADELRTTERREGVYAGFFTFLRKLAGASAVALAGVALDLAGFVRGGGAQPESALQAIRLLTGAAPAVFIALAIWMAWTYPISREVHARIRQELETRRRTA